MMQIIERKLEKLTIMFFFYSSSLPRIYELMKSGWDADPERRFSPQRIFSGLLEASMSIKKLYANTYLFIVVLFVYQFIFRNLFVTKLLSANEQWFCD
jgi:hypothetical protein